MNSKLARRIADLLTGLPVLSPHTAKYYGSRILWWDSRPPDFYHDNDDLFVFKLILKFPGTNHKKLRLGVLFVSDAAIRWVPKSRITGIIEYNLADPDGFESIRKAIIERAEREHEAQ